ncbi:type VII secretion-associated protein [Gordonia rhizosphera]|uniref:Type VII secretion-associated protein n=1 Tax=Gordonia rhizosphera NBRC 16068 TaxID=1108045 RepID=K6W7Z0_9ACTN|nr:type VII secretion-associated protein [Gordonia rhizosphera]GAB89836.1 hypothetical protein GORHZ_072_00120 [Gordonia rhizosphera NBRC 16068]
MMSAPQPPLVVDLAYGRVRLSDGRTADATELLNAVDAATVPAGGAAHPPQQAWQGLWRELRLPDPGPDGALPIVIGYPSTWGRNRLSELARSSADLAAPVSLVPRAVLIARSHCDVSMQRCAVIETTHVPAIVVDPARPPRMFWDVTLLRRSSAGWEVDRTDVLDPGVDDVAARIEAIVDDSVEAVYVDGADPERVAQALDVVAAHAVAGRIVAVDRELIRRYGWRTEREQGNDWQMRVADAPESESAAGRRPRKRWIAVAGALALVVAVGAVVVGVLQHRGDDSPTEHTVVVGRVEVSVLGDWRRSDLDPRAEQGSDTASRTVFADPDDGRRILVVQSEVRSDSTLESVATSLGNRIAQRGDEVVSEFSPSTRFAGREVIGYREAPASGSAIRWYVLVEDGLQVSIGCQAGATGESVDAECARAVSSVVIAPD